MQMHINVVIMMMMFLQLIGIFLVTFGRLKETAKLSLLVTMSVVVVVTAPAATNGGFWFRFARGM